MAVKRILTILLALALMLSLGARAEGLVPEEAEGEAPAEWSGALWTDDMANAGAEDAPRAVAAATVDGVAISESTFPDARFRAIVLEKFDKDGDGWLSEDELYAVKTVDVSDKSIFSLRGIEYFTNLRKLDCSMNWLDALDVSANGELRTLNCNTNDLGTLDVSHNPKLQRLYCMGTKLMTLDVTHNPNLLGLYCNFNYLSALDVSQNPKLVDLYCGHNRLNGLDVTANSKLKELYLPDNQVSALNLKKSPKLKLLNTAENSLKKLDLSACTALKQIVGRLPLEVDSSTVHWVEKADVAEVMIDRSTALWSGATRLYRTGKPTSVSFGKKTITLKRSDLKGKQYWFALKLKPAGVVSQCTFTSSKKSVLSVRADGLILKLKAGTATLTVKTANGLKKSVKVVVK